MNMKEAYCFFIFFFGFNLLFANKAFCESYTRGEILYKSQCTVCHLVKSENPPVSAYHAKFKPLDFTTCSGSKNLSKEKIYFVLREGQGIMKPVKLKPEDSKALVDYMINDLKKNCK
ncbi:MAG: cytochrome c [Smithella sp.]